MATAAVVSDVRPIRGTQFVDQELCLVFQSMKLGHVFRQQETERLETGLEWAWLEREVVGMLHDTLQCTLSHRHVKEVGQPQQLTLYCMPILQFTIADDQQWVPCVYIASVSSRPLPPFFNGKLSPFFSCIDIIYTLGALD